MIRTVYLIGLINDQLKNVLRCYQLLLIVRRLNVMEEEVVVVDMIMVKNLSHLIMMIIMTNLNNHLQKNPHLHLKMIMEDFL